MILAVTGWREWTDAACVRRHLSFMEDRGVAERRVGDARGVDKITADYWEEYGLPYTLYRADWNKLGLGAGPRRNWDMLTGALNYGMPATMLMAFPEPHVLREKDSGTWTCIKQAVQMGGCGIWTPPILKTGH